MALLWLTYRFSEPILVGLIPMYQCVLQWLDARLVVEQFAVVRHHGENFLFIKAVVSAPFFIGADYIVPDRPLQNMVNMPAGNVLLPLVALPSLLLVWPVRIWQEAAIRGLVCVPAVLVLLLLDIPVQFCFLLWDGIVKALHGTLVMYSPLAVWSDFLNAGGLIALSFFAAMTVIAFSRSVSEQFLRR